MAIEYPYSEQAERAVLGAMLMESTAVTMCVSSLYPDDFYLTNNKKIFQAIKNLFERSIAVDVTTVTNELEDLMDLETIGGVPTLVELTESVVTMNLDYYIDVLKDKTNLRTFANFLEHTTNEFGSKSLGDINVYLNQIEKQVLEITRNRRLGDFKLTKDVIDDIHTKIYEGKKNKLAGLDTGFPHLTSLLQGWHAGNLIILAARPGVGKTALALNFAYQTAKLEKRPVAIFSLEMPAEENVERLISSVGMIDNRKLKTLNFDNTDFLRFDKASKELSNLGIYIDDTPNQKLIDVQAKARKLKNMNPSLCMIVIDYLNLMSTDRKDKENRQQEVADISRGLKALARELQIPVIACAQLNRSSEQKGPKADKRPGLADLRESGAIEQDADIVMFIYREDYYSKGEEMEKADSVPTELIIEKHRSGARGTIKLFFTKSNSRFREDTEGYKAASEGRKEE